MLHLRHRPVILELEHTRRIAHGVVVHPYRADVLLQGGEPLQLSAAPGVGDGADDIHTVGGSPYANIAYSDAATVWLLDDALLPIREYRVL
jgi:hypothetical protein